MIPSKPLSKTKRSKIDADTAAIKQAQERKKAKDSQSVRKYYEAGGKPFVEAVRRYGRTDRGTPLNLSPWFIELLELTGDLRVHEVVISGAAQCGKTQSMNLLNSYCLVEVKLNTLTVFDQAQTRDRNVPTQFRPVIDKWIELKDYKEEIGITNNQLFQYSNAKGFFRHANSSKATAQRSGLAAAGSSVVSLTADILFTDERSQFAPGTADPLPRRLDASQLASKPQRHYGTKGSGLGVEVLIDQCQYDFYPAFVCDGCNKESILHPLGCLLKPVKKTVNGKEKEVYFSESGRPLSWWAFDQNRPIETAYLACPLCGHPIRDEQRRDAYFVCQKTGINLRDFLDGI